MPNVSAAAQRKVADVRALLWRMTVPCVEEGCENQPSPHAHPDPDLDGLRELVEKTCPTCEGKGLDIYCDGTGRVTRDWTHSLRGSLRGALEFGKRLPKDWAITTGLWGIALVYPGPDGRPKSILMNGPDPDRAVITALEAALTAQLEAANA